MSACVQSVHTNVCKYAHTQEHTSVPLYHLYASDIYTVCIACVRICIYVYVSVSYT